MLPNKLLDEVNKQLHHLMPQSLRPIQKEVGKNIHQLLNFVLARLNLVTYEEFHTQEKILKRTREKLETLEKKISELEKHKHKTN